MVDKPHGRTPFKTCPNCGKESLVEYLPFRPGMEFKCEKCGYVGPLFFVEEK